MLTCFNAETRHGPPMVWIQCFWSVIFYKSRIQSRLWNMESFGIFLKLLCCVPKLLSISTLKCMNYCLVLLGGALNEDWFSRGPKRIISRHLAPNTDQLWTAFLGCEVPVSQLGVNRLNRESCHSVISWHCGRSSHTHEWPDSQGGGAEHKRIIILVFKTLEDLALFPVLFSSRPSSSFPPLHF